MKKLGVIGGLGPLATACFIEMTTMMTDAKCDQEHIPMAISSLPETPDRTRFILGISSDDPYPLLLKSGQFVKEMGAEQIVIPCNTAQYFHNRLEEELQIPVIHLIRETAKYLQKNGIEKVGIMATDGTIQTGLYQKELLAHGIESVVPDAKGQEGVMHIIYQNVKAGLPPEMPKFNGIADRLKAEGAQVVILGCTELSVIKRDKHIGSGFIDAMQVMAKEAILRCGGKIKIGYENLIS
ncbi:MAG: amino acid racemase [Lachnospiraceae bacterium]|nr:amino acid racemase [Lachnospiraceae bacterium]